MKRLLPISFLILLCQTISASDVNPHIQKKETPVVKYLKRIEVTEKKSGMKGIDCIYLINLDSRPDRWKRVKKLLDEKGLKVNRVSAVNGWELKKEAFKEMSGHYPVQLKGGEYGCFLSHVSVLKDAYRRGYKCIWILEDDLEFPGDPQTIPDMLKKLKKLDKEWDIFYTDGDFRNIDGSHLKSYSYSQRPDQPLFPYKYYQLRPKLSKEIQQLRSRWGTTSMIFSKRGIKKVLDYFTHVYVWSPIDHDIHTIPGIHEYAPTKDIVSNWTQSIDSDTKAPTFKTKQPANQKKISQVKVEKKGLFELAQEYHGKKEITQALLLYAKRAAQKDRSKEVFWSLYQTGRIQEDTNEKPEKFLKSYFEAYHAAPTRAEPLYRLASYYRRSGDLVMGYFLAKQALACERPSDLTLIEDWIYDYGLLMELSLSAYYLGKYEETKQISELMLRNQNLPQHFKNAALDNLKWVEKQLSQ